jgi:RNA polymerase sigma factor (sigma-70 family)
LFRWSIQIVETEGSVTHWICELKDGDEGTAQQELFNRYFKRLTGLARTRLRNISRRAQDEEDVAMQALASFFEGVKAGNFPQLDDRTHLWPLLVKITVYKALDQRAHTLAQKRGRGQVRGDSVRIMPGHENDSNRVLEFVGHQPTPALICELDEQCGLMMSQLDDQLQTVARLKLEGYTNAEIAEKLDVVERTVERKLKRIRNRWSENL